MRAQRLSDTPIEPSASAGKVGDNLAHLMAAWIGVQRAALAFTSILSPASEPAGEPTSALFDQTAAAITPVIGLRQLFRHPPGGADGPAQDTSRADPARGPCD